MQRVTQLSAASIDDYSHRQRRAVLLRAERAEVVGDALGQHRHDAVGEVDRIAALQSLAVERRARRDIGSDVGDRHRENEAARIVGIGVSAGVHCVVVVFGVGGIDGDEGQVAPVLAAGEAQRARRLRRCQRLRPEHVGDAVRMNGDEAHRLFELPKAPTRSLT